MSSVASDGHPSIDDESPWVSLPADLARLVGSQVLAGDLLDYIRFRAVCPHWRSVTVCPRRRGIVDSCFRPRRWMMLPDGHGLHPQDGSKRFFNLSTAAFLRARVDLLRTHDVLCQVEGLLLLRLRGPEDTISLLHPFTGAVAELPPFMSTVTSSGEPLNWGVVHDSIFSYNAIVASLNVSADRVVTVMIVLTDLSRVAFATTKDEHWTLSDWRFNPNHKQISFHGKMYMVNGSGRQIFRIDPPRLEHGTMSGVSSYSLAPPRLVASFPTIKIRHGFQLVECQSEILLTGFSDHIHMLVYRLSDLMLGQVIPLTSVGGNALLVDVTTRMNCSFSAMPTIESDTIVRPHLMRRYLGQYHLTSGTWTPIVKGCDNCHGLCTCSLISHISGYCHCAANHR
ncbi:hypothetical protein ACQ4PT_045273 [Festuca glaucescens]